MKLVLLGAPGAGKGTQAKFISEKFSISAISTGALIREEIAKNTLFGIEAKNFIEKGELLPDEMITKMLLNRISEDDCKNGFILDGFPRTVDQAKYLEDNGIQIDVALSLEIDDDVIIKRLSGRRECVGCRATYHIITNPPKVENVCDVCGKALITRADDNMQTIEVRLKEYYQKTAPVKNFYKDRGILKEVMDMGTIEQTAKAVQDCLMNI